MEFCCVRPRQARHDHDALRYQEAFEASLAFFLELLLAECSSLLDYDKRFNRLPEELVGNANDRGFPHARNIHEHVLHLLRSDFLSPGFYDLVAAADEVEITFRVNPAVVTGVQDLLAGQRTGLEFPGRGLRLAPIASHHRRAANDKLANYAGAHASVLLVDNPHLRVRDGDPYAQRLSVDILRR